MRRRPIMKQKLEIPHKEETPLFKLDEELERPTTPVPIEKNCYKVKISKENQLFKFKQTHDKNKTLKKKIIQDFKDDFIIEKMEIKNDFSIIPLFIKKK
jgi:hypothetical protein